MQKLVKTGKKQVETQKSTNNPIEENTELSHIHLAARIKMIG